MKRGTMHPLSGSPIGVCPDSAHFACFSDGSRIADCCPTILTFFQNFDNFLLDRQAIDRLYKAMM